MLDLDCSDDPGKTVQADRDDADINKIIARYTKSGQLPPMRNGEAFCGDVSDFSGLQDALIKVQQADELFMDYPAELRERFDNDPVKLVDFLADGKNYDEALKLGLVQKRPDVSAPGDGGAPPKP